MALLKSGLTNKVNLDPPEINLPSINYRRCISCRRVNSKESFWRIVRSANDQTIQLDRGMGRSAYLCPNAQCFQQAKAKNRLSSALRTKVPPIIYQNLQNRLDP